MGVEDSSSGSGALDVMVKRDVKESIGVVDVYVLRVMLWMCMCCVRCYEDV